MKLDPAYQPKVHKVKKKKGDKWPRYAVSLAFEKDSGSKRQAKKNMFA